MTRDLVGEFEALSAQQRRAVALVEYRCRAADPCRLLTIWHARGGRFWYTPKYKITEAVAIEETAESARAKRTDDGMRRWKARAGSLDELIDFADGGPAEEVGQFVNCRHLRNHYISWCDLQGDAEAATVGSPTWVDLP